MMSDIGAARSRMRRTPLSGLPQPALLALLAGGVCIGLAPIFARLTDVGPFATGGYRMAIALVTSMALLAVQSGNPAHGLRGPKLGDLGFAALAGVFFAGDLGLFFRSLETTSVAHATLLVNLAPVFALLGGWVLFGERPRLSTALGLTLALAGAALLALAGGAGDAATLRGDLLALSAAGFYAAYLMAVKRARRGIPPDLFLMISGLTATAILLPAGLVMGEPMVPARLESVLALLGLGLIGHALAHRLISNGLATLPVGYSSVVLLIQPTVAAIAAWAIFGETLSLPEAAGAVLALAGIVVASRRGP